MLAQHVTKAVCQGDTFAVSYLKTKEFSCFGENRKAKLVSSIGEQPSHLTNGLEAEVCAKPATTKAGFRA